MKRKLWIIFIGLCAIIVCGLGVCYVVVSANASGRIFDNVDYVPEHEYGLLLGTSPITSQGAHNYYFDNRIKAAAELYHAGKVRKIIASGGDYSGKQRNGCNELVAMRDSLMAHGVPGSAILLDYEGLRTINSIVKVKEKLGIDSCVIISQGYHNARAIWQADHYGLKTVAYNAKPSPFWKNRVKNIVREVFARPKMFLDLCFDAKPSFNKYYTTYIFDLNIGKFENGDLAFSNAYSIIMKYTPEYYPDDIEKQYQLTDSILRILCESKIEPSTTIEIMNYYNSQIAEMNFLNWWLINEGMRNRAPNIDACSIEKEKVYIDSLVSAEMNFIETHIDSADNYTGTWDFVKSCNIKLALYSDWNQQLQELVFNLNDENVRYDILTDFPMSYIAQEFSRLKKDIRPSILYDLDLIDKSTSYDEEKDRQSLASLQKAWENFIIYRNSISGKFWTGPWNKIYANATIRFKRSLLIQLKNEFEGMGICSSDMLECLLPDDCSDEELFSYPGYKVRWSEYLENP